MTPHIMRSEADQARILAEESAKMHWCLPDIAAIHGHGMEVMGPASQGARVVPNGPPNGRLRADTTSPAPRTSVRSTRPKAASRTRSRACCHRTPSPITRASRPRRHRWDLQVRRVRSAR